MKKITIRSVIIACILALCTLAICLALTGCSIEIDRGDSGSSDAEESLMGESDALQETVLSVDDSLEAQTINVEEMTESVLEELRIALVDQSSRQPWDIQDEWTAQCLMLLCDPLFEKGEDDSLIPALAEKFSFGRDPESGSSFVTITLRSGIRFHNGSMLDAADVIYTINKLKTTDCYYTGLVEKIRRAEPVGTDGVRLYFDSVSLASLEVLTFPIVPSSSVSAALPSGTGPYQLSRVVGKRELELGINPNWYGGQAQIDTIRIYLVPDQETLSACFETGRINLYTSEILEWGRYSNQVSTSVHSFLTNEAVYLEFSGSGYCMDPEHRMAIAKAIDAQGVLRDSYYGRGVLSETLVRPNTWYMPEAVITLGTEKEKTEYAIELTLLYDSTDEVLSLAAGSIKRQLEDLGYSVILSTYGSYFDIALKRGFFDLTSLLERQNIGVNGAMNYTTDRWMELSESESNKELETMDTYGLFFMQGGTITGYGIQGDLTPWREHVFKGIDQLTMGKEE